MCFEGFILWLWHLLLRTTQAGVTAPCHESHQTHPCRNASATVKPTAGCKLRCERLTAAANTRAKQSKGRHPTHSIERSQENSAHCEKCWWSLLSRWKCRWWPSRREKCRWPLRRAIMCRCPPVNGDCATAGGGDAALVTARAPGPLPRGRTPRLSWPVPSASLLFLRKPGPPPQECTARLLW